MRNKSAKTTGRNAGKRTNRQAASRPFNRQPRRKADGVWKKYLVAFIAVLIVVWLLLFSRLNSTITYTGNGAEQVQAAADTYFAETSRFRVVFDEQSFEKYLERSVPFAGDVSVDTSLLDNTVSVKSQPQPVELSWQSAGRLYGLNAQGYIVDENFKPEPGVVTVFDNAGLQYDTGQRLTSDDFVFFVRQLESLLSDKDKQGLSLVIEESTHSLSIVRKDYKLIVSTEIEPLAQLQSEADLLKQLQQQGRGAPSEYIDTRIAGKVYWK